MGNLENHLYLLIPLKLKMFGHQVNFPTNFSSHCASYPEKLATSFISFIMDHPVAVRKEEKSYDIKKT
jgi:hypothetical protein